MVYSCGVHRFGEGMEVLPLLLPVAGQRQENAPALLEMQKPLLEHP